MIEVGSLLGNFDGLIRKEVDRLSDYFIETYVHKRIVCRCDVCNGYHIWCVHDCNM